MEMHSLSPFRNEAQKVMKQFLRKIANNSRMNLDQVNGHLTYTRRGKRKGDS